MAQGILETLVKWGLLLLFLGIFLFALFNPKFGLIQKVSKIALGAEAFLPDEPAKEVTSNQDVSDGTSSAQKKFMDEIKKPGLECIFRYSSMEGLEDSSIEIINYNNGIQSRILKHAGSEDTGSVVLNPLFAENLELCTINPERFLQFNDYQAPASGTFRKIDSAILTRNGIIINGEQFMTDSMIFKPLADRVCIVPFSDRLFELPGCKPNENSLDDGCIGQIKIKEC